MNKSPSYNHKLKTNLLHRNVIQKKNMKVQRDLAYWPVRPLVWPFFRPFASLVEREVLLERAGLKKCFKLRQVRLYPEFSI